MAKATSSKLGSAFVILMLAGAGLFVYNKTSDEDDTSNLLETVFPINSPYLNKNPQQHSKREPKRVKLQALWNPARVMIIEYTAGTVSDRFEKFGSPWMSREMLLYGGTSVIFNVKNTDALEGDTQCFIYADGKMVAWDRKNDTDRDCELRYMVPLT